MEQGREERIAYAENMVATYGLILVSSDLHDLARAVSQTALELPPDKRSGEYTYYVNGRRYLVEVDPEGQIKRAYFLKNVWKAPTSP